MTSQAMNMPPPVPARTRLVSNEVMGMLIWTVTESMFFAGFISAYMIVQSGAAEWPPPGQPRLPIEQTALNTAALILSGVLLIFAQKRFKAGAASAKLLMLGSLGLGAFFVLFQGIEWVALIGEGLTMTSSVHGGFFYLLVGAHGLHAILGVLLLVYVVFRLHQGKLRPELFSAVQVFWAFVVLLWPVLYWKVYLS